MRSFLSVNDNRLQIRMFLLHRKITDTTKDQ